MPQTTDEFERLYAAVGGQESNDDYSAVNGRTGCKGRFQIDPANWASWCEAAGLAPDSEWTEANQDKVARNKLWEYYQKYGARSAAICWYGGEGALRYSAEALNRKQGKGDEPSINEYADQILGRMGGSNYFSHDASRVQQDAFGNPVDLALTPEAEPVEESTFMDRFLNQATDSLIGGGLRTSWLTRLGEHEEAMQEGERFSHEDIEYVKKLLPDDYTAQMYVLMHAKNRVQLQRLTAVKQLDTARRKRVDASSIWDFATIGSVLGSLADPLNFIPGMGVSSKGAKLFRYAKMAGLNAAVNTVERAGAQQVAGYKQDLTQAAIIGAAAGALIPMAGDLLRGAFAGKNSKNLELLNSKLGNMQQHSVAQLNGTKYPNEVFINTKLQMKQIHDAKVFENIRSEKLQSLVQDEKAFVVSAADLQRVSRRMGIEIPEGAKAFHVPGEDYTVFTKEALQNAKDIDGLIAHEIGVHAGLKRMLGDTQYDRLMDYVKEKTKKPKGAWKYAMRAAVDDKDLEEILGYFVQQGMKTNGIVKLMRSALNKVSKSAGSKKFTDQDILDVVRRSTQNYIKNKNGYETLDDGSVLWGGLRFSKDSILNPNNFLAYLELDPTIESQKGMPKKIREFGRIMEASLPTGTPFGVGINSKSELHQTIAAKLFHDARMAARSASPELPAEKYAEMLLGQLNAFQKKYWGIRTKYLLNQHDYKGLIGNSSKLRFDREAIEYYNREYAGNSTGLLAKEYAPEVMEAAEVFRDVRRAQTKMMQNSARGAGYSHPNLLPENMQIKDSEFTRISDDDLVTQFITNNFRDTATKTAYRQAIDFLYEYAVRAVKRDEMIERLVKIREDAFKQELREAKASGNLPSKRPEAPTAQEIDAFIQEKAREWAMGVADRNCSNLEKRGVADFDHPLALMRERFPMDTTVKMQLPNGAEFSFDGNLRSYDVDHILSNTNRRLAGHIALSNVFPGIKRSFRKLDGSVEVLADTQENVLKQIESELKQAARGGIGITEDQVQREMKTLQYGIDRIAGVQSSEYHSWDRYFSLMRNAAYARNGINMSINQLAEVSGPLAYIGRTAICDLLPFVGDLVEHKLGSKTAHAIADDMHTYMFGERLYNEIFSGTYRSYDFHKADIMGIRMGWLNPVNELTTLSTRVVSAISGLPKLTYAMEQNCRKYTVVDSLKWLAGKQFDGMRNPFSEMKLRAAGIQSEAAFKEALKPYIQREGERIVGLDVQRLHESNPGVFFQYRALIDNQAMRAIQQETVGNSNYLKDSAWYWRLFFQFKNFTMMATNGQFMRALSSRERDDALAALLSHATNLGAVTGMAYLRAKVKYPNDEQKQEEYFKAYYAPETLMRIALFRNTFEGAPLSMVNDVYEGITGTNSIRTTVDRNFGGGSASLGNLVDQFPVVQGGTNMVTSLGGTAYHLLDPDSYVTRQDVEGILKNLPGQNHLLMEYLRQQLFTQLDLPEKNRKKVNR